MTKTTYFQPRTLLFTGASNAFTVLFLLLSAVHINFLTPVSAFAPHQQRRLQHCVRFAPIVDHDLTAVGMVSTLANGGYDDIVEESFLLRAVSNQNSITNHAELPFRPRRGLLSTTLDLQFVLPRRSTVVAAQKVPAAMEHAERLISRVAMLTALVLIANELATGQSLPDQIGSIATLLIV